MLRLGEILMGQLRGTFNKDWLLAPGLAAAVLATARRVLISFSGLGERGNPVIITEQHLHYVDAHLHCPGFLEHWR